MVMDAGAAAAKPSYVASTRLPAWLLPNVSNEVREGLRPDLLLVPLLPLSDTALDGFEVDASSRTRKTVHIIEVGYCGDLRHGSKQAEKSEQHAELARLLRAAHWTVQYGAMEAVTLGAGGTIRSDLAKLLAELGVPKDRATACALWLHKHAVTTACTIIRLRRYKERAPGAGFRPARRPP